MVLDFRYDVSVNRDAMRVTNQTFVSGVRAEFESALQSPQNLDQIETSHTLLEPVVP